MLDTSLAIFWGIVVRSGQAIVECSPTLLCGFLVAGVLRRMVPASSTRKLFGNSWTSLPRAWLIGTLLPVCSFGVIPVCRELKRAGVSSGTILTFALTAPLLNPLSILYGLTLSSPFVILCFVAASMLDAVVAGAIWTRMFGSGEQLPTDDDPMPEVGLRRLGAVVVHACREATGPTVLYIAIGLFGVGLTCALLPKGSLQSSLNHGDPLAPAVMAAVSIPAYAPPMKVMMMLGLMFDHGNSIGAAYVLLVLGAGLNLGLLAWMCHNYGPKRMILWLIPIAILATAGGYAVEYPLHFAHHTEDHTHAFDDFTNSFNYGLGTYAHEHVWQKINLKLGPFELTSLAGLFALMLGGILLRLIDPKRERVETYLLRRVSSPDVPQHFWNRPLPPAVLGVAALFILAVCAVVGAYVYYPDSETVFDDMQRIRADAFSMLAEKNRDETMRKIRQWDDLIRKLQVGTYIRRGTVTEDQWQAAEHLRHELEVVYDALSHWHLTTARKHFRKEVFPAYEACREAFKTER